MHKTIPDEAELIELARQDRQRGFGMLFDRFYSVVAGFLRYLGARPAEVDDFAQEAFLRAYRRFDQFIPGKPFSRWLLAIARNTFIDHLRTMKLEKRQAPMAAEDVAVVDVEEQALNRLTADDFLASLDDDDRLLIELRLFLDLTFPQIEELLDVKENALRVRFCRLLQRFRADDEKAGQAAGE